MGKTNFLGEGPEENMLVGTALNLTVQLLVLVENECERGYPTSNLGASTLEAKGEANS